MRTAKISYSQDTDTQETANKDITATDVYIWGSNHQGQLGLGNQYAGKTHISPRSWPFSMAVAQISCGEEHTAFITLKGQVYTLGSNLDGRLGIGSRSVKQSSTPCLVEVLIKFNCLQISCGWGHTAALMDSGEIFTWGVGEHGALGTSLTDNVWTPERITFDNRNLMRITKVATGTKHTALLTDTGMLYACGNGETGQLGTGKRDKELTPVHVNLISEKVRDVACGPYHTLILTERGKVYATGGNTLGQLGTGSKKSTNIPTRIKELDFEKIVKIGCGHHSAALNDQGQLFIWGTGVFGEVLSPAIFSHPGLFIKEVSLGAFFGTAIDERGSVWTWGTNSNGELGLASNDARAKLTHNPFFDDKGIENISCGGAFAIAVGRTVKPRASPRKSSMSPYTSNIQTNNTEGYESPGRKPNQIRLPRNVSYDLESEDTYAGGNEERLGNREKGLHRKLGHVRGISMDRSTRSAKKEVTHGILDESPGKLDTSKRKEDRAIMKESMVKTEDSLVELLVKQKNVLEKCLKDERDEKRIMEQSLKELKKRLRDLHDGPGGFLDLGESLNKQAKKFDELKHVYEEELKKKERVNRELGDERKITRDLNQTIMEKEETILILKKKIEAVEIHSKEKSREMEEIRQSLLGENRRLKHELDHKSEAIITLERALDDLKTENMEKKNIINKLESSINRELEEKRDLEVVSQNLSTSVKEVKVQMEKISNSLHNEKEIRLDLEKELEASMQREQACQEHARQLLEEVEHLRNVIEQNMINEHENNARMIQDRELLTRQLQERESEIQDFKIKIGAMEQDLAEHQEKNKKLISILSNEIEKQADEFKKKTYQALVKPAGILAQNIIKASREGENQDTDHNQEKRGVRPRVVPGGSPLLSKQEFTNQGENSFGSVLPGTWNAVGERNPSVYTGENAPIQIVESQYTTVRQPNFPGNTVSLGEAGNEPLDLERLRKELYEEKSTVESRIQASPGLNRYGDLARSQLYIGDEYINEGYGVDRSYRLDDGPRGSVKQNESVRIGLGSVDGEDARARLNKSANKLRNILDMDNNDGFQGDYFRKSTNVTPMKEERKRDFDRSGNSKKSVSPLGRSVSPIKNVSFRDKMQQIATQGSQTTQDTSHLQSLREVKQRLEMLQKNKQVLEDKMQDYEKRVKAGPN